MLDVVGDTRFETRENVTVRKERRDTYEGLGPGEFQRVTWITERWTPNGVYDKDGV